MSQFTISDDFDFDVAEEEPNQEVLDLLEILGLSPGSEESESEILQSTPDSDILKILETPETPETPETAETPVIIADHGTYVSITSTQSWGESHQNVLKLEPRKKPSQKQISTWKTERTAGIFTLENAHMWPHSKRNELMMMHGFNPQDPHRNDPWARGTFGVHGRINAQARFACGHCATTCSTKVNLRDHMNIHRRNNRFKCRFCEKTFTNHGNRNTHEKSSLPGHLNQKTARCTICSKPFAHGATLRIHMLKHTKAPLPSSCSCDYCDKKYTNAPNANRHMRNKHPYKYMTRINVCRKRKRITEVAPVTKDLSAASLAVARC